MKSFFLKERRNMEKLCNQLLKCSINNKPVLYDMMIYDFVNLSYQYSQLTEFTFDMNSTFDSATSADIQQLAIYIQQQNVEKTLHQIIQERYPLLFVEKNIVTAMMDYYLECLMSSI